MQIVDDVRICGVAFQLEKGKSGREGEVEVSFSPTSILGAPQVLAAPHPVLSMPRLRDLPASPPSRTGVQILLASVEGRSCIA